jgi:hypothetical protein
MLMEIVAVDDWILGNGDGVKAMARTCSALLLAGALLPALRWRPTNKALLGVVSACAHKLREVAVDAGGSVRKEAALLADSISAYVDHALQVPQGSSDDTVLRARVDALKERCADLLSTQCTITQQ